MLLFGHHVVEAALRSQRRKLQQLWSVSSVPLWKELAEAAKVPHQLAGKLELDTRCQGGRHQGVALDCGALPWQSVEELLSATGDEKSSVLVVLDQVLDPRNLGSIARAAGALGARGMVLPRQRSAPLSVVASRASAGALEWLPLTQVVNLARFLKQAHQQDWWRVAAVIEGGQAPEAIKPAATEAVSTKKSRWILVLGGEGKGIRPLVQSQCDYLCTIPQSSLILAPSSIPASQLPSSPIPASQLPSSPIPASQPSPIPASQPSSICLSVSQAATILLHHFC